MKAECPNCPKVYDIPEERLPKHDRISFPCPDCKAIIRLDPGLKPDRQGPRSSEQQPKQRLDGNALKAQILRNVMDLPPMPQTVLKAREILADPKSDFQELAELFETDQAIATKVLKFANSAHYGLSGRVSSIKHAALVLGHKALGDLIIMGGTAGLLGDRLEGYGLDAGALWKHSLAVALGSRIIADRVDPTLTNDAFTAGLIHDSGKLILNPYITERWKLFEEFMAENQHTFLDAEKKILKLDHSEVASEVCKLWNIPKAVTKAIKYHHQPSRSNGNKMAYIVHLADAIAMMTGMGLGIDGTFYQMDDNTMEVLNLKEEDINDIMGKVIKTAQKISE